MSEAHKTAHLAELVCSNSFRSDDAQTNAVGLLHEEMRRLGSLILRPATQTRSQPAALSRLIATASRSRLRRHHDHPLIEIRRAEISAPRRTGTV